MIKKLFTTAVAARLARNFPLVKLIAIAQVSLVAGRHLANLDAADRRRLVELVRHPRSLGGEERRELRRLVSKLEPGAFLANAADRLSPVPLPERFTRRGKDGTDGGSPTPGSAGTA